MTKPLLACLFLTTVALSTVPSPAAKSRLSLSPADPQQGDAVFVRFTGEASEPELRWQNERYPLYRDGSGWRGNLPVSADTPAGRHPVAVRYVEDGTPRFTQTTLQVRTRKFPVQYLKMARSTASLYNYPGVEKEDDAVSAAIRVRSDERLWSGDWRIPSRGRFSTEYGVRRFRNGRPVGRHRGLDIAAPTGTPIVAPAAGRVVLARTAKQFKKYGGTVVLDHGQGLTTMYLHMSQVGVKDGQRVKKGHPIGKVGDTGVATGPHLHWSAYLYGESLHPMFFTRLSEQGIS
ncbi:MAG: M23 family metallopeptidase [Armatimonadota bacterium]